jgi:hypothetical protein
MYGRDEGDVERERKRARERAGLNVTSAIFSFLEHRWRIRKLFEMVKKSHIMRQMKEG